ncbi:unnamed protein product [Leptidea sinapis]|uniref:Peptidase M16 N-terminal domain-containing protein n=1 Tax=Leptidea sinapis TaxID=189913 RepID=A0A5E4PM72_9NEOP|nr:unnamed protein product [Leptidea sinapis]
MKKKFIPKPVGNMTRYLNYTYPNSFFTFLDENKVLSCSTLSSGLTVATEQRNSPNSCVGIFIDAGSRYESSLEYGVMHFFEHICFKGTENRSKSTLEKEMTATGAKFRCFTTREMVGYYAECLNECVPMVVDILSDCVFYNSFQCSELEIQKKIVYSEMLEHEEDTKGIVFDYLHQAAFQGTPLSNSILGPSYNLHNLKNTTVARHIDKMFAEPRTKFVCVGGITHDQMEELGNTYLSKSKKNTCVGSSPYRYTGSELIYRNDSMGIAHIALAVEGPPFHHEDHLKLDLATAVIGSWDRSQGGGQNNTSHLACFSAGSGFCSHLESFNIAYKDCGLWGAYFVVNQLDVDDMVFKLQREWIKLCTMMTDSELLRAKMQVKSNLLAKTENVVGACLDIATSVFYSGCLANIHRRFTELDRITLNEVKDTCNKYLYDKCPTVAAVGATECLPSYVRTRAAMNWLRV